MKGKVKKPIDDLVRKVFEPRYRKPLSDEEVDEIRQNLRKFAEGILRVAVRLHGQSKGAVVRDMERSEANV